MNKVAAEEPIPTIREAAALPLPTTKRALFAAYESAEHCEAQADLLEAEAHQLSEQIGALKAAMAQLEAKRRENTTKVHGLRAAAETIRCTARMYGGWR